jgi:hypothetical protein
MCIFNDLIGASAWWFLLLSPCWDDEQIKTWQNDREAKWQSLWDAAMFDTSSMCDLYHGCHVFCFAGLFGTRLGEDFASLLHFVDLWCGTGGFSVRCPRLEQTVGRGKLVVWTTFLVALNGGFQSMVAPNHPFFERFSHGNQPSIKG